MTEWSDVSLAVIAVATGVMALAQIGVFLYIARLSRRVTRVAARVERELDPVLGKVQESCADAAKAVNLALALVDRADQTNQAVARLARRADETLDIAQKVIVTPARRALALFDGLKSIFAADPVPTARTPQEPASSREDEPPTVA